MWAGLLAIGLIASGCDRPAPPAGRAYWRESCGLA